MEKDTEFDRKNKDVDRFWPKQTEYHNNICYKWLRSILCFTLHLRGYCTPGQFWDCFCVFLKKLQHISNKKDMFLIGNISGNLISALEFH